MENTQPTTFLLCRWLDPNASRAETDRHFTEFRQRAHTLLYNRLNFLAYKYQLTVDSSGKGTKQLTAIEKLLHELLIRLCILAMEDRPVAIEKLLAQTAVLSAPDCNPPDPLQVDAWTDNLKHWTDLARNFFDHQRNLADPEPCETQAKTINTQVSLLQIEGYVLLDWLDTKTATLESTDPVFNDSDEYSPGLEYQRLREAIKHIERLYYQRGSQEADLCAGAPGGAKFVIDVGDIIDTLPKIQIPGMGLLFRWSEWVAIDLNRDGKVLGVPLPGGEDHIDESDEIAFVPQQLQISDTLTLEQWSRLQKIDSLLRAPVQTAKQKYEAAKTKAEQNQAKKRLESAKRRYLECINVFMLGIDGYSRSDIAGSLGMTEDEVRGRKAQIAELLAPEFIEAYRHFQGEKLMRQLVKLDQQEIQNLIEIAGKLPLPEWPSEVMTHLLKLPQAQANARLRIAEQDKRSAETQLLEKVMENSEPMNRVEAREAFLKTVMATDLWDQHTLASLGLKRDNVQCLKQKILKANLAIHETSADLETLQQDFTRRATLYPVILGLILNSRAADEAAIANQLGLKNAEQLQQYRKRIQAILEHISFYRGD